MWNEITKEELLQYDEIVNLSDKEKNRISLVLNRNKNHMAIRKIIAGNIGDIYYKLKGINHINLPKIYCIEEEGDHIVVLEEYLEGITLQDILGAKHVTEEKKLLSILHQLCSALMVLHELPQPIIHRDIKPSNLILNQEGILKLIDFDASRVYKKDASRDTISLGTLEYAAPEQFGFAQTDNRSDIYGTGMLLAEFLRKSNAYNKPYKHYSDLKKIVDKCTMFDPNQRYQTTKDLKKSISKIEEDKKLGWFFLHGWPFLLIFLFLLIFVVIYCNNIL